MVEIKQNKRISGSLAVPGDKSISHRMLIFASLARGNSELRNLAPGDDVKRTQAALRRLGVDMSAAKGVLMVRGREGRLIESGVPLNCGNSGTTTRLMSGVLAAQPFFSVLFGDESLSRRPMARVTKPLQEMGAQVWGRENGGRLPLAIRGGNLRGKTLRLEQSSAQVKSALLLAGLQAEGTTSIIEPIPSRDHSERILRAMGAKVIQLANEVSIEPGVLNGLNANVPGDISSAAFFIVLGVLHPKANIQIESVNLNLTRTGVIDALTQMGADVRATVERESPEPTGSIAVRSSRLKGIVIGKEMIPRLIDELPILALAATQAEGKTIVRGASELRKKESDRIATTVETLKALGAKIEALEDGFEIEGPTPIVQSRVLDGHGDHRIIMMQAIAGAIAPKGVKLNGAKWVGISYPGFFKDLKRLIQ